MDRDELITIWHPKIPGRSAEVRRHAYMRVWRREGWRQSPLPPPSRPYRPVRLNSRPHEEA